MYRYRFKESSDTRLQGTATSLDRNNAAAPKPVFRGATGGDTISPLIPAVRLRKILQSHSSWYPVGIIQLPRFAARSVTVDLWRTRGVQTTCTAAKVIPDKSLGSKRFPARGMSARGKSPRFMVAIRRIVSRHSSNITTLGASRDRE